MAIGISVNGGIPITGWFTKDNPIKIDENWGYPHFSKSPYLTNKVLNTMASFSPFFTGAVFKSHGLNTSCNESYINCYINQFLDK